jgi:hypothetical protein
MAPQIKLQQLPSASFPIQLAAIILSNGKTCSELLKALTFSSMSFFKECYAMTLSVGEIT